MKGKTIIGVLVMALFLLPAAYAQEPEQNADEVVQKMTTDLNLSVEQVHSVRHIVEDSLTKRQELFNSTMDRSSIKDQLAQLKKDEDQQLAQVLTPDQATKLNSLKAQRHQAHQHQSMRSAGNAF